MISNDVYKLLNLRVSPASPSFILYSEKKSPRLNYVTKFIFEHVLKVKCVVTNDFLEFEKSPCFKINYALKSVKEALHIIPQEYLFIEGVSEINLKPILKNNMIYFFENKNSEVKSNIDYDIFSAVFYFISRHEEWLNPELDKHSRFELSSSVLYKNNFHKIPVVDNWILELKHALKSFFKGIVFPENKFTVISTIDVDNLYAYKKKGFLRTIGAFLKDLFKLDIKNLIARKNVVLNKQKDPFDIYSEISNFCEQNNIPLIYFFLYKSGTKYDRTIHPKSNVFSEVINQLQKTNSFIGLHPSYFSYNNLDCLNKEIESFSELIGQKVQFSRQHYLRFDIKITPKLLIAQNIKVDFTMGFATGIGFRAGTSFPFFYYDFNSESETELLFLPFCAMDGAYFVYDNIKPEEMLDSMNELSDQVKKVGGIFVTVFHERTFSEHLYPGYEHIYKKLYQKN